MCQPTTHPRRKSQTLPRDSGYHRDRTRCSRISRILNCCGVICRTIADGTIGLDIKYD